MPDVDLCGALRRIRRTADLSQRELALAAGVSAAVISHAEAGRRGMAVDLLSRLAAVAGLRLALLDGDGRDVAGMADGAVRDEAGRRHPAHLDTRYGDVDWWHGRERYSRDQPTYTFDRVRETRDYWRGRLGTPDDHQLPRPGDAPAQRRAARRWAARSRTRGHAPAHPGARNSTSANGRCTRSTAHVGAMSADPLLPWQRARQPPAYPPRRGPLLGRPPRRGDCAFPGACADRPHRSCVQPAP
jgi:transcriptional regulator with XRE-family HTH domain